MRNLLCGNFFCVDSCMQRVHLFQSDVPLSDYQFFATQRYFHPFVGEFWVL